jgi:glucosamine kinase
MLWEVWSAMAIYVALDAGGTKTQCWVADETRVLGRATSGTVKIMMAGETLATERLREVILEAAGGAGVDPKKVTRTCMGLAGVTSESTRAWAERTLGGIVGGELDLCGDEEIALDAAFHGGPGLLVVAGTGSNIVGRCSSAAMVSAGGWGPVIGDEGSGTWIGLEAIRAGLRAHDRGVPTCLLREIEVHWELEDLGELIAKANERLRPDFAGLAMVVSRCAEDGDALAASVLDRAGVELAEQVSLAASKMRAVGCAVNDTSHVAFTGSVLEKIVRVRRSMEEHLHAALPEAQVAQQPVVSMEGALWRARKAGIRD